MEILLQDGSPIKLSRLYQYNIYSGLLCGMPPKPETYVREAVDIAQTHFPNREMVPVVLEPVFEAVFQPFRIKIDGEIQTPDLILPSICTIAEFDSFEPARNPDEFASSVRVIWFQDHYGLPQDVRTLEQLSVIDWKTHAYDWTP